jgi:glycerol kinase
LIDHSGQIVSRAYREFYQVYPQPGWVEHDPQEIWAVTVSVAKEAIMRLICTGGPKLQAIGITNQRENDGGRG